ncbi:MAG: exodeoxyribonuclease VII large subunit [Gammaproteobacteria bacterium]|nr:exodeoxyribonuclease VII large subunit [Gammaproteobacteria bacterium]
MKPGSDEPVFTVSELNREARELLEGSFPAIWVEGEISNFIHHGSGHMYFDLKDPQAQVRCAMFRSANRRLKFQPENGLQVLLHGKVTVYEPRGSYQVVAEHLEPAGEGLLRRRLEELRARLQAEGLFAADRKRPLPELPQRIGVITSPTGAAVRDIVKVLRRRFPAVPVVIYPSQVQGDRARHDLVAALETAARRAECDVLIVGRGGGSLEDLWAFNEESVVRAMAACPIPVVSAVGHETDVTLADFVADLRAPTPSAAAETVVPDTREWLSRAQSLGRRAGRVLRDQVRLEQRHMTQLQARLRRVDPRLVMRQHAQRVDELGLRMRRGLENRLAVERARLARLNVALQAATPLYRIRGSRQRLATGRLRLAAALRARIGSSREQLASLGGALHAVSPLATLERGYALIEDETSGRLVRDAGDLEPGQTIKGRLARGSFLAEVKKTSKR